MATRVGDGVGIWSVGTPPRLQRQGAGRRLYDSLGFAEADRSEIWLKGSSTEFPGSAGPP